MTEPQPTIPSSLERYAIDWSPTGYLGAGAYGTIYKGIDKETGKPVALKAVGISGVFNHLVLREVTLLAYLAQVTAGGQPFKNPAIDLISSFKLRLDDTTKDLPFAKHFENCSSLICLVTPLYPHDCERFRTYNLVSSFTLSQMVFFWHSVVTCLRNLHRLGIAHRDVKPSNILLDGNGSAFLADLGMAKYCVYSSPSASANYAEPEVLSADHYSPISTGTTCTLVYRAPESTLRCYDFLSTNGSLFDRQESVTPTSLDALGDVYSLGLTLLESIISRVVFFLPLEHDNPRTNNNSSPSNPKPPRQDASQKHNIYLFKMQTLFISCVARPRAEVSLGHPAISHRLICLLSGWTRAPLRVLGNGRKSYAVLTRSRLPLLVPLRLPPDPSTTAGTHLRARHAEEQAHPVHGREDAPQGPLCLVQGAERVCRRGQLARADRAGAVCAALHGHPVEVEEVSPVEEFQCCQNKFLMRTAALDGLSHSVSMLRCRVSLAKTEEGGHPSTRPSAPL
ncbi:Kinase [Giardia duodenalis]|uniref:Kinase n=1 Tax=Giardia intestinalis (strain ATCC 50803 / WB clone C6) TaxID=184922 RepID=A8B7V0_GIAIC|nr:Kinase [Giardia intestinalis]KAE8305393.1 Kinase [Giardia intestinalis]|eukprot:XP_001708886.1 Kinase [Giardia lamblia ATCC 50803]